MNKCKAGLASQIEALPVSGKIGIILELALGLWYPLAGFVLAAFFRFKKARSLYYMAPFVGAVASLLLYTVQFFVQAAAGA